MDWTRAFTTVVVRMMLALLERVCANGVTRARAGTTRGERVENDRRGCDLVCARGELDV
jgi:hypothetical protein